MSEFGKIETNKKKVKKNKISIKKKNNIDVLDVTDVALDIICTTADIGDGLDVVGSLSDAGDALDAGDAVSTLWDFLSSLF